MDLGFLTLRMEFCYILCFFTSPNTLIPCWFNRLQDVQPQLQIGRPVVVQDYRGDQSHKFTFCSHARATAGME
jgi:hypothetical protein